MNRERSLWTGLLLLLTSLCPAAEPGDFFFRDGDRVVFLGDSITEQRLYTTYLEAYALTRFPERRYSFRNVGWGGDTAWLRQRAHPDEGRLFAANSETLDTMVKTAVERGLGRDVLPLKPTVVTIKFGMNDHSYQPFREDIFRAYTRSQAELGKVLKENGARVAFLTPQPIEDKRPDPDQDPRNQSLRKFSDGLREVAARNDALFVDQFDPFMKILLRERSSNPPGFVGGGNDAVHPGPAGHLVMAWVVLKGLGASAPVSALEIDAASGTVLKAQGCAARDLKASSERLSFERTDRALPLPIDSRAKPALGLAPILDELSQYTLKVTGLAEGEYELTIDGVPAGKSSAAGLAQGWNLTLASGPIERQTQELLGLVVEKNNLYFNRWRAVQLYDFPAWLKTPENQALKEAELKRLDDLIAQREATIEQVRQPKPHRFELKRSGT